MWFLFVNAVQNYFLTSPHFKEFLSAVFFITILSSIYIHVFPTNSSTLFPIWAKKLVYTWRKNLTLAHESSIVHPRPTPYLNTRPNVPLTMQTTAMQREDIDKEGERNWKEMNGITGKKIRLL